MGEPSPTLLAFPDIQEKSSEPRKIGSEPAMYPSFSSQLGWNLPKLIALSEQFTIQKGDWFIFLPKEVTWSPSGCFEKRRKRFCHS